MALRRQLGNGTPKFQPNDDTRCSIATEHQCEPAAAGFYVQGMAGHPGPCELAGLGRHRGRRPVIADSTSQAEPEPAAGKVLRARHRRTQLVGHRLLEQRLTHYLIAIARCCPPVRKHACVGRNIIKR